MRRTFKQQERNNRDGQNVPSDGCAGPKWSRMD